MVIASQYHHPSHVNDNAKHHSMRFWSVEPQSYASTGISFGRLGLTPSGFHPVSNSLAGMMQSAWWWWFHMSINHIWMMPSTSYIWNWFVGPLHVSLEPQLSCYDIITRVASKQHIKHKISSYLQKLLLQVWCKWYCDCFTILSSITYEW